MNIAAVVVLFNPNDIGLDSVTKNIFSYAHSVKTLYLVDNSLSDNSKIAELIPHCIYLKNNNIGGIAGGLNKGCERALQDGFDWCMTMDQDSAFDEENLNKYLKLTKKYSEEDKNIVSFAPDTIDLNKTIHWTKQIRYKLLSPIKRKILGSKYKIKVIPDVLFPDDVITSANIINLHVWEKLNGFDEMLFIEQVDVNFCRRLIASNYKIIQFRSVVLEQHFGEKNGFTLLPKYTPKYGKFRLHYIFRNILIERKRFPEERYKNYYNRILRRYFWDYCINSLSALKNLAIFISAYKDYKNNNGNRQQTTDNRQQTTDNSKIIRISCQASLSILREAA